MVNFNDLIDINRLKTFWNEIKSKFAAVTHTHTKSDITDFPSSLKNPHSLSINKNGTAYSYDGSSAVALGAFYTPTAAGTAGFVPVSQGSGAPLWKMPDNYAVCSTAAGTVAKTAAISNFKLVTGVMVTIKFTYAHTATTAATLNVNSTGAKTIYYYHGNQATKDYAWEAGETVVFQYDGSYWRAVASDRFAKKFAALEEKIESLGGLRYVYAEKTFDVKLAEGATGTYTITLDGYYTHGYLRFGASSADVAPHNTTGSYSGKRNGQYDNYNISLTHPDNNSTLITLTLKAGAAFSGTTTVIYDLF